MRRMSPAAFTDKIQREVALNLAEFLKDCLSTSRVIKMQSLGQMRVGGPAILGLTQGGDLLELAQYLFARRHETTFAAFIVVCFVALHLCRGGHAGCGRAEYRHG